MTHPDPTTDSAAPADLDDVAGVAEADVLVEDVSIDGMCGVY